MRMAWMALIEQTGQEESLPSQTLFAQSMQKKLWPQGTKAWVTLPSEHTRHFEEPNRESEGLALFGGEGLDVTEAVGYDQILEIAVELSKLGDSPRPSSLSFELQMAPRSPRPPAFEELLEQDPELEKAPVLPVDEVMVGNGSVAESM